MPKKLYEKTSEAEVSVYREALKKYLNLMQLAKSIIQPEDRLKLKKAFHFAIAADKRNRYWEEGASTLRALDIAWIVANDIGLGVVSIICALLYDLVEEITLEEIKKTFGTQVAQTIDRLVKLESIAQFKEIRNTENSEALVLALTQDPKVVLLKMAEKLQKMRTLDRLSYTQQASIASHARYIYVPIAHRLGLHAIKAELEDLHFKFVNPVEYHTLIEQLKDTRHVRERFIKRFEEPIQEELGKKELPCIIKTRIKSLTSIRNKMSVTGLPLEQVYDIFAIRIVLNAPEPQAKLSCWQAYEIVTNLYKPHPTKFRNWLSYPRPSGYQALHATVMSRDGVWVEVQIRTKNMDSIAENGRAAHWRYKEVKNMEHISGLNTWLNQIRAALEQESKSSARLTHVTDPSPQMKKMEVFTSTGQVVTLPIGATVLDCAFALNTRLGMGCAGAQVNNKLVAHGHTLCHGDQVKIITNRRSKALEDLLEYTVTRKAHNVITKFLQRDRRIKVTKGQQLIRAQFCQSRTVLSYEEYLEQLLVYLDEEKVESLCYKLGEGSIALRQIQALPSMFFKPQEYRLPRIALSPWIQDFDN